MYCIPDLGRQVLLVEHMVLSSCSTVSMPLKEMNLQMSQNPPAVMFFSFCGISNKQITMKSWCHTIYPLQMLCLRPKSKPNHALLLNSLGTENPAWVWFPEEATKWLVEGHEVTGQGEWL